MFKDECVVCFEFETVIGSEPNPDFDAKIGLRWNNCPNRLAKKVDWVVGADGPNNLGIRGQQSFSGKNAEEKARKAANVMAKKYGREEKF